jgi:hypothetical protein
MRSDLQHNQLATQLSVGVASVESAASGFQQLLARTEAVQHLEALNNFAVCSLDKSVTTLPPTAVAAVNGSSSSSSNSASTAGADAALAILSLERAITTQPHQPLLWANLAMSYERCGQPGSARVAYERGLVLAAAHPAVSYALKLNYSNFLLKMAK